MRVAWAALLLALLAASCPATLAGGTPAALSPEAALLTWLSLRGAHFDAEIRPAAVGRQRGVYALRAHADGELIVRLPFATAVPMGKSGWAGLPRLARAAFTPGSAYHVNGSFAPFWATQPPLDALLCVDTLSDTQLDALQAPPLAGEARATRAYLAHQYAVLQAELASEAAAAGETGAPAQRLLSLADYTWLSALTTTRAFDFWVEPHDTS